MVKKFLKKRSKRQSCKLKYKVQKKVHEHNRKVKKEAKKNGTFGKKKKDPGIPNSLPFKDKILAEAMAQKAKVEQLKLKQKEERHKVVMEKRGLEKLAKEAEKRANTFDNKEVKITSNARDALDSRMFKPFYREFNKVVEAADVILEVLDARDPIGSRCPQVEKSVLDAGPRKRLVLVLNKIDLIPSDNLAAWLKYLKNEFPTVPFKASTQLQRNNLSRKKLPINIAQSKDVPTTRCLGAELLMKLLGNYCRTQDIKTSIRVGVVGFPNVGKSSIINSLKRSKACNIGATPGVTRKMQEVQLDKHIVLLDCPGIVLAQSGADASSAALRNAIKVDDLVDPIPAVEAILRRTNAEQLATYYRIPSFDSSHTFLALLGKRFGRLKKGGVPDVDAAAKSLIHAWNIGKIKYYTRPPETSEMLSHVSAEIVTQMSKEFDLDSLLTMEQNDVTSVMVSAGASDAMEIVTSGFTDGTVEGLQLSDKDDESEINSESGDADDQEEGDVLMSDDTKSIRSSAATPDTLGDVSKTKVEMKEKKGSKISKRPSKKTKSSILEETGMKSGEGSLPGNQKLNRSKKDALKKLKKKQKKSGRLSDGLSESLTTAMHLGTADEDYNFELDFH